jgi:putative transposase
LQATLAPPTTHKESKLRETLSAYREALREAFDAGCDTQRAVNGIVTDYDLTSYAKDALKNYVPQLRRSYDAGEIEDDHPIRFTNRGWRIDYSPDRDHGFCWRVPQAGRGNAFWVPLRINPTQRDLWHDLHDGEASVGEFRLQRHRTTWELHVTVEYEVEEPDYDATDDGVTPVGVDIGEAHLLAGCARTDGSPTDPLLVNGGRARRLRKKMYTTLKRLQERDAAEWRIDDCFDHYQNALTDIVEKASRRTVEYAHRFEKPVVVLEDLSYIRERLDYGKWMNRRLHAWAFARLQGRIEDKAAEAGIPVEYVNPSYTSQTCHECGHVGRRDGDEFRCTNPECWVTEYHADINAAVNIGDRLDPWGESLPLKPAGDDIPRDGSACDSATTHRETSENPSQMTLSTFHGSKPSASNSDT